MNKTPIMILQEVGVKENIIPNYDIICSQNSKHTNIFTYRVKYDNLCADGTSSSKKQAKQNAAQNMLKLLQQNNNIYLKGLKLLDSANSYMTTAKSSSPSLIEVPSDDINYIGILQEYCVQNRLREPEYKICESNGPAHNMTFKMSCTIGTITEEAVANKKKQAKQQVARKILQKLPNVKNLLNSSNSEPIPSSSCGKDTTEAIFQDLGIKIANLKVVDDKHLNNVKLKYLTATSKEDFQPLATLDSKISVDNYHLYLKSMIYSSICTSKEKTLNALYGTLKTYVEKGFHKQAFTYIKEECKLPIKRISLTSKSNMAIVGFRVNITIPFTQFGIDENSACAEKKALTNTIETIMLYLK